MPFMVMSALLVVSIKHREYLPFFRKITAFAGLIYLPWILRMMPYMDWLGSATDADAESDRTTQRRGKQDFDSRTAEDAGRQKTCPR